MYFSTKEKLILVTKFCLILFFLEVDFLYGTNLYFTHPSQTILIVFVDSGLFGNYFII